MKVFMKDGKVNFIDKNNVLVGYDLSQSCCEHADWYISESSELDIGSCDDIGHKEEYPDHVFDKDVAGEIQEHDTEEYGVVFRLIGDGVPDLFLHLFNCHNGYYSHGFHVDVDGVTTRYDYL